MTRIAVPVVTRVSRVPQAAQQELRELLQKTDGAVIVKDEPRYLYAEFAGNGGVDDVEFLFSSDVPVVGYRSAPRKSADDKAQRNRVRELRKKLAPKGWKSIGRSAGVNE